MVRNLWMDLRGEDKAIRFLGVTCNRSPQWQVRIWIVDLVMPDFERIFQFCCSPAFEVKCYGWVITNYSCSDNGVFFPSTKDLAIIFFFFWGGRPGIWICSIGIVFIFWSKYRSKTQHFLWKAQTFCKIFLQSNAHVASGNQFIGNVLTRHSTDTALTLHSSEDNACNPVVISIALLIVLLHCLLTPNMDKPTLCQRVYKLK